MPSGTNDHLLFVLLVATRLFAYPAGLVITRLLSIPQSRSHITAQQLRGLLIFFAGISRLFAVVVTVSFFLLRNLMHRNTNCSFIKKERTI